MQVLFVSSEVAPIKKFGGLGDYSGSLPKALLDIGVDIHVIMPFYSDSKIENLKVYKSIELVVEFNNQSYKVDYLKTKLPNSNVDVVMCKSSLSFSGDFLSETDFYAFFNKCVVQYIGAQYNTYDIIHCNDWHTGFIPHLLTDEFSTYKPKTLFTIHNIAYSGTSDNNVIKEMGFVPGEHPVLDWDSSDGDVSMLLQGLTSSDYLSTVSESYADELLTKEFGGWLTDILRQRSERLIGILNGIDYSTLPRKFDSSNWKDVKIQSKNALINDLKIKDIHRPLFSYISRLDPGQKGVDILYESIPFIVENGGNFVLLGTGDPLWENKLRELSKNKKLEPYISINIEFDVKLANRIYEASDFFMIPSKYEPCGLTQMMSMWYGTLPIVRDVGGLKDTVIHGENGFKFNTYDSKDLKKAIKNAFDAYLVKDHYENMVDKALGCDFSWDASAGKYKKLYQSMLKEVK